MHYRFWGLLDSCLAADDLLSQYLPLLASRGFIQFLLYQYDQYSEVEYKFKSKELSPSDEIFWKEYGGLARRGIKYLVEMVCCHKVITMNPKCHKNEIDEITSIVFIAAEELTNLYIQSDQTHNIFPKNSILVIKEDTHNYFNLYIQPKPSFKFYIRDDTNQRSTIVGEKNFLNNLEEHNKILGKYFIDEFGIDYLTVISIFFELLEGARPVPDGFSVYFLNIEKIISKVTDLLNIEENKLRRLIDGFSLYPKNMERENRKIYNPKQENRALRRAFFVYPHEEG